MSERTLIIAEACNNHNQDLNMAFELIRQAKAVGADVVKFQSVRPETMFAADHWGYEVIASVTAPYEWHKLLADYARKIGIEFASTAGALDAVDSLDEAGTAFFKVGSSNLTNYPLLRKMASKGRSMIISTGMGTDSEIEKALDVVRGAGVHDVTLLHCTVVYPSKPELANLRAMAAMHEKFRLPVGFSDHTLSTTLPAVAVGIGATVIEKHFTLSRNQQGPDHGHSLTPTEFKVMVKAIREAEVALGTPEKRILAEEQETLRWARRGIYFVHDLPEGHKLTEEDLIPLRPNSHIGVEHWDTVIGHYLMQPVRKGQAATWDVLNARP